MIQNKLLSGEPETLKFSCDPTPVGFLVSIKNETIGLPWWRSG